MIGNITYYSGPASIENYAFVLNNYLNTEEKNQRLLKKYIGFSMIDKSFFIKKSPYDDSAFENYHNNEIINFHDRLSEKEQSEFPDGFGFFILAGNKKYVIFLESKSLFRKWLRILNYFFYQIDIDDHISDIPISILDVKNKESNKTFEFPILSYSDFSLSNRNKNMNEYILMEEIKNKPNLIFNNNKLDNYNNNYFNNSDYLSEFEFKKIKKDFINSEKINDGLVFNLDKVSSNIFSNNIFSNNLRKFKINPLSNNYEDSLTNFNSKEKIPFNNLIPINDKNIYKENNFKREFHFQFRNPNKLENFKEEHVPYFGKNKLFRSISTPKQNNYSSDRINILENKIKTDLSLNNIEKKEYNENNNKNVLEIYEQCENQKMKKDLSKYDTYYDKTKINFIFDDQADNQTKDNEVLSKKANNKSSKSKIVSREVSQTKIDINKANENREEYNENLFAFNNDSSKNQFNSYSKNDFNPDFGSWDISDTQYKNKYFDNHKRNIDKIDLKKESFFSNKIEKNLHKLTDEKNLHLKVKGDFNKINLENLHYGVKDDSKIKKVDDFLNQNFPLDISNNSRLNSTKINIGLEIKRRQQLQEIYNIKPENKDDSTKITPYVKVDGDSFIVNIAIGENHKADKLLPEKHFHESYSKNNYDLLEHFKMKIIEKEKEDPIYLGKNKPPEKFNSSNISYKKFSYNYENMNNTQCIPEKNERIFNYYNNIDTNLDNKLNNTKVELNKLDNVENPFKMNAQYDANNEFSKEYNSIIIENKSDNKMNLQDNYATEIDRFSESNKKNNHIYMKNASKISNDFNKTFTKKKGHKTTNLKEEQLLNINKSEEDNHVYLNNHDYHTPITKTIKIDEKTQLSDNIHLEMNYHQIISCKENNNFIGVKW